jgi:hypothetical protein
LTESQKLSERDFGRSNSASARSFSIHVTGFDVSVLLVNEIADPELTSLNQGTLDGFQEVVTKS